MTWTKLPPYTGARTKGCLNCGAVHEALPLTAPLAVGFGRVGVFKDEECVWSGDDSSVWLRQFEKRAQADPDHDWRVRFDAPLYDATYQRQDGEWILVEKGRGFA